MLPFPCLSVRPSGSGQGKTKTASRAFKGQLTRKSPTAASEITSMWRRRQLAQLCRYLIGGSKIKPLTAFACDHRFKCAWTVPSCGRTRLIVCCDFVKLLSELEIRPKCLPSTPPRTFSLQAPEITSTSSPGLNAFLSRLLLSLTRAEWEITPCHKAAPQRPRPRSDIHCFRCDRVLQQHFSLPTYFSSSHL